MIEDIRKLHMQHLTIRVPWHDNRWNGTVCSNPCANTSCTVLPHIAENRDDRKETLHAGMSLEELDSDQHPPCVDEHGTIMAPFPQTLVKRHPYKWATATHGHFADTPFTIQPYSAAAVPFRWMLRTELENSLTELIPVDLNREPDLAKNNGFSGNDQPWLQEGTNQKLALDTFFSAVVPEESLVFFYAKRTPLTEDQRRVIVGVGRVKSVAETIEYRYETGSRPEDKISSYLWEHNVKHSIRPRMKDGFLLPYDDLLRHANEDVSIDLTKCSAFAPDEYFLQYSFGSELLSQDGAVSSLLSIVKAIEHMRDFIDAPWPNYLKWIDQELNRLWKTRGAFPGLGAALHAFGIQHANFLAWHLQAQEGSSFDPWARLNEVMENPALLPKNVQAGIGETFREKWQNLPDERRELLFLLSRFALSNTQAHRWYHPDERKNNGIDLNDTEIIKNPYLVFEEDRHVEEPIAFVLVDRGVLPPPSVRMKFPLPKPSRVDESIDPRRVRALMVWVLECAAKNGHTLLPTDLIIQAFREVPIDPACPLDVDTIPVIQEKLIPLIHRVVLPSNQTAFQLDRYKQTASLISTLVSKRKAGTKNAGDYDWLALINGAIDGKNEKDWNELHDSEQRARREKADALKELFQSRVSVLLGSAGTGKSTLIRALCQIDSVMDHGFLLLAPTGKARVRLEKASGQRGGKTVAQFLLPLRRYNGNTGRYYINPNGRRTSEFETVVIDECSMLTEDQLAALLDSVKKVSRLILVGDPNQLPPIGAGRPFVDIVNFLKPPNVESLFPRVAQSYAELTVSRRQHGPERLDVQLANAFNANHRQPGLDDVWHSVVANESKYVRLVRWNQPNKLQTILLNELVSELGLDSIEDEVGFECSIGGKKSEFRGQENVFFDFRQEECEGAAEQSENWQILSPTRQGLNGVLALNRAIQQQFRKQFIDLASVTARERRIIPRPYGPENIVYGDKVINVVNTQNLTVHPPREDNYVANGDIGIVVGHRRFYKVRDWRPKNVEVELASQPGYSYTYRPQSLNSQENSPPLELAYALTVHKTQGSEFKTVFTVIPNPCRTLSREMLYTALTRHTGKVIVLHEGDFRNLERFASVEASEIVRRMTNLFVPSEPVTVQIQNQPVIVDKHLVYLTTRGELVRSKSEWIIADRLHEEGIDYQYEQTLNLSGSDRKPDFTIIDDDAGINWYWEHNGLLDDIEYKKRWEKKLEAYRDSEILPLEEGGGANGTLLVTEEKKGTGLRLEDIKKNINAILGREM